MVSGEFGFRVSGVSFTSVTINWKGVWLMWSASDLGGWRLVREDFKILSSRVLIGGLAAYNIFNANTATRPANRSGIE